MPEKRSRSSRRDKPEVQLKTIYKKGDGTISRTADEIEAACNRYALHWRPCGGIFIPDGERPDEGTIYLIFEERLPKQGRRGPGPAYEE